MCGHLLKLPPVSPKRLVEQHGLNWALAACAWEPILAQEEEFGQLQYYTQTVPLAFSNFATMCHGG